MKQSDLDINNANSLSNQRATRSRRERIKLLQDEEKSALTGVLNTSDKREIKGYYEEQRGQISDISVGQAATDGNQDKLNNDISQDGVDTSVLHDGGGGAGGGSAGITGIRIVWADQTEIFISVATILEDHNDEDYWSVVLAVSDNAFTKDISYDDGADLWDDTGDDQTLYRLRVIAPNGDGDPVAISTYGQYRAEILCVDGKLVNILI